MCKVYIHLQIVTCVFLVQKQECCCCCCFLSLPVAKWWPLLWCCNARSCSRRGTSAIIQKHFFCGYLFCEDCYWYHCKDQYRVHHRREQRPNISKVSAGQRLRKASSQLFSFCCWSITSKISVNGFRCIVMSRASFSAQTTFRNIVLQGGVNSINIIEPTMWCKENRHCQCLLSDSAFWPPKTRIVGAVSDIENGRHLSCCVSLHLLKEGLEVGALQQKVKLSTQ